ncbi:MAG: PHB depolymerase family esterase [Bacteroidota bacterium]|nr:PHB depolymerase family esterase [Bacteroidota bacterium]
MLGLNNKHFLSILLLFLSFNIPAQELKRIRHFGRNKGHLKMYVHTPSSIDKNKKNPLVVVLHGCTQCAESVAAQTGWNKLADEYGFYVLYPQQRFFNNPEKCFRWYKRRHIKKNRGENASIKKMIDHMKTGYGIDSSKVFITGLSAGAAMGVIMMADYPETFNAGSIFAGAPYKAGRGIISGAMAMLGWRVKSPQKWGDIVRKNNRNYSGNYPRMIVYQGNSDWIVNKRNGVELMEQWTNLHQTTRTETFTHFLDHRDIERNGYYNSAGKEMVVFYRINKLSHALMVDPGYCKLQGGKKGFFSKDKNFHSTLWTAYDFGLISMPFISGKTLIDAGETITFSVPASDKSTYEWKFPSDCIVVKNDSSNSLQLKWGSTYGTINVTETDSLYCKKQFRTLLVNVKP